MRFVVSVVLDRLEACARNMMKNNAAPPENTAASHCPMLFCAVELLCIGIDPLPIIVITSPLDTEDAYRNDICGNNPNDGFSLQCCGKLE